MKLLISSFLFFLTALVSYGQAGHTTPMPHGVIIAHPRSSFILPVTYQLHDGIARLTDGSLLRGRFLYNRSGSFNFYQDGHSARKQIEFGHFERLTLAGTDTSVIAHSDSTVFLYVNNHLLRRLTIGKVGLYDKTFAVNEDKGKIGDVLFTWSDNGKIRRLYTLEDVNKWFYEICQQNHWPNPDVFLSKTEIIRRLAQLDPIP